MWSVVEIREFVYDKISNQLVDDEDDDKISNQLVDDEATSVQPAYAGRYVSKGSSR